MNMNKRSFLVPTQERGNEMKTFTENCCRGVLQFAATDIFCYKLIYD
jgi:hypothetical protein